MPPSRLRVPGWRCAVSRALGYVTSRADLEGVRLVHGLITETVDGAGLDLIHAWVEIRQGSGALFDPSSGCLFDLADYYRVLHAAPLLTYTPPEALERLARWGHAGPWELDPVVLGLVQAWTQRLRARCPGLLEWVAAMRERDPGFAAEWERSAERDPNRLTAVHVLAELERHPERWQGFEPGGTPWRSRLHPLARLW